MMAQTQKPDFVFRRNGRVHLNRRGASVQPTAGSRGVRIRVSNTGYNMFRGRVRVLATHSILQFPLHFPSRASPCAIRFQTHSTYYKCAAVFLPYVSGMQSPCSVLYCHLWPVWFYYIFTHYLIKGTIYVKKKGNRYCIF